MRGQDPHVKMLHNPDAPEVTDLPTKQEYSYIKQCKKRFSPFHPAANSRFGAMVSVDPRKCITVYAKPIGLPKKSPWCTAVLLHLYMQTQLQVKAFLSCYTYCCAVRAVSECSNHLRFARVAAHRFPVVIPSADTFIGISMPNTLCMACG